MKKLKAPVLMSVAMIVSVAATAQVNQPMTGVYLCKMEFMHMMPGTEGTAMINGATCSLEGDEKNTIMFTNNVMFGSEGVGKLINSNGFSMQEGKPVSAYVGMNSKWVLKMKDGQMVGYSAEGVNDIVAGENAGKQIHWQATPTGPDTARISYEVK